MKNDTIEGIEKTFITRNIKELKQVAQWILDNLTESKIVTLNGELGAGKTTLVKEIAKLLGIKEPVTSPSFNYMKKYKNLVHIDAYNLKGSTIYEFEDYIEDGDIVVIEWSSKLDLHYSNFLEVNVRMNSQNDHVFTIRAVL